VHDARQARTLEADLARERAQLAPLACTAVRLPRITPLGLETPADTIRAAPRLMFSDTPDFVAWTTGRPTVWVTREEYERLPAAAPVAVAPPAKTPKGKRAEAAPLVSAAAPPDTLPTRGGPEDTWFHARFER
jgi:hypothetical protein